MGTLAPFVCVCVHMWLCESVWGDESKLVQEEPLFYVCTSVYEKSVRHKCSHHTFVSIENEIIIHKCLIFSSCVGQHSFECNQKEVDRLYDERYLETDVHVLKKGKKTVEKYVFWWFILKMVALKL